MATLKRGSETFTTNNDNVISAFINNGYEVVVEKPQPQPEKKAVKKASSK